MKKNLLNLVKGFIIFLSLMIADNLFADSKNCQNLSGINRITGIDNQKIDVNQIAAWISNDGVLYSDPYTGQGGFFFPKGESSDKTLVYTAGPWLVGKINNEIRSASVMYATEFQPGMILANGLPDDPQNPRYKVFKFTASNWDSPEMVADRAEAIVQGMEDKLYGDQMLYCVFNDGASHSGVWALPPIGIEVRMTVFGFNRPGPQGSAIFVRYVFINKGTAELKNAYFGQFFDNDLGQSSNDMVGCDSTLGVAFTYNRDPNDDVYGTVVPCFGCDIMQGPVVPSPGDTAYLPDQTPLIDYKILRTTSFAYYT